MTKLPFMKFFPEIWLRDTRKLTPPAKAAWIDILAYCWNEPKRGHYRRSREVMARELGMTEKELSPILAELSLTEVADILEDVPGTVLIKSRHIVKIESKREYERKKKQMQRRPRNVPVPSPNVPNEIVESVPIETLDVRRKTLDVRHTSTPLAATNGGPKILKPRAPKPEKATPHWQDLVSHIDNAWMARKHTAYPWSGHEFRKLHELARTYQAHGVMALWDLYMSTGTYWGKLTGYMIDGLKKDIGVIVDDVRWKSLSRQYEDKLLSTDGPLVSVKELTSSLGLAAKGIP